MRRISDKGHSRIMSDHRVKSTLHQLRTLAGVADSAVSCQTQTEECPPIHPELANDLRPSPKAVVALETAVVVVALETAVIAKE